jgi:hypothetical protein
VLALALAACSGSSSGREASAFIQEHGTAASRMAASTRTLELQATRASHSRGSAADARLAQAAVAARREVVKAGEWNPAGGVEAAAEEEDLPRAESEVTDGADDLLDVVATIEAYARAPRASTLARYESELSRAREQWNEGISELWFLARRSGPPTI